MGFFDLTDPTEANAALNAQEGEIAVGTYRYVRIEFCHGSPTTPLVRFKTAAMEAPLEGFYAGCGVTSARMEPPVEIVDGETVTIALEYDLTRGPLHYVEGNTQCGSADTPTPCVGSVELTPRLLP